MTSHFRTLLQIATEHGVRTGKNNGFPFLDILGYKYPKISKNGNPLFFPVPYEKKALRINITGQMFGQHIIYQS